MRLVDRGLVDRGVVPRGLVYRGLVYRGLVDRGLVLSPGFGNRWPVGLKDSVQHSTERRKARQNVLMVFKFYLLDTEDQYS